MLKTTGVTGELPIIVTVVVLAAYTHSSGLPALALFRYLHWITGVLAAKARGTLQQDASLLPISSLALGFIALLFTRSVYEEYLKKDATPTQEAEVAKLASLAVTVGAVAAIVFIDPQFSIDLQLIGGAIILQTLPSVGIGLYTDWLHRGALIAGWTAELGFDAATTVYTGFVALLVNLAVTVAVTVVLRAMKVVDGVDGPRRATTRPSERTRRCATCPVR